MSCEQPTLVVPTPADEALCDWLTQRYSADEYATRIQVCQWRNGQRGDAVFTHDQRVDSNDSKPKAAGKPKLTRERLVEISNRVVTAAQSDCDSLRQSTVYAVLAFHPLVGADAYSRHLLRCAPKSALDVDAVVAEDSVMSTKLLLGLLADERRHSRWSMELAMNVASGALDVANQRITTMQTIVDSAWQKQAALMTATEDALSRAAQRKQQADLAGVKVAAIRDGVAMLKGLVPGVAAAITRGKVGVEPAVRQFMGSLTRAQIAALVGSETLDAPTGGVLTVEQAHMLRRIDRGEAALVGALFASLSSAQFDQLRGLLTENQLFVVAQVADGLDEMKLGDAANGAEHARTDATAQTTATAEQQLLGKLFDALPEDLSLRLFGDWEVGEGGVGMRCVSPGVLTAEQFFVMARVAKGKLPPSALDDLLPESGRPEAITAAQREQAAAILPLGAAAQLAELFTLRATARQAGGTSGEARS